MINIYYTNKHYYKKLLFIVYTLFLLIAPNNSSTFWVDKIADPHILHDNYSDLPTNKGILCTLTTLSFFIASGIKLGFIYKNLLEKNEPSSWKSALFYSCCTAGSSFIFGLLINSHIKKEKKVRKRISDYYYFRTSIKKPNHHFATAILIHNKNIPKKTDSWQKISLNGVIQLESLASQTYEKRLTEMQKKCPSFLSWLLPQQNFETRASFTINKHNYPLRKPCEEHWIQARIRALLSPHFPQRSLALQEKITQKILVQCLHKRLKGNPTQDTVGTLLVFPPEIIEYIFSYVVDKGKIKSSKIDISNEEFFIHILPYIGTSHEPNYLIIDTIRKNDAEDIGYIVSDAVQLPKDTGCIVNAFYDINDLFEGGEYYIKTQALVLQEKRLKTIAKKQNITKEKFIKKLAKALNLQRCNITYYNNYRREGRPFCIVE